MKNTILTLMFFLFIAGNSFSQSLANLNKNNLFPKKKYIPVAVNDITKIKYYTINTAGSTFFTDYSKAKSKMNITTLHGISRYLDGTGSNAVGLGLGINFDFMDKTNITFFYEPRLIYDNFSLFANLGYSLGQEKDLKGFAFASGVGIAPVKVAKRFKLDLDGGYGDKGGKSFYFLRGGIIFL